MENSKYATFKKYGEVPEIVTLDFTEDDVTCIASKLYVATGALTVESN